MTYTQQVKPKRKGARGLTQIKAIGEMWLCFCRNTPLNDGFYPCDTEGEAVEPTPEAWTTNWYVCARCGRIIDQDTRRVVGVRFENAVPLEERTRIWNEIQAHGYPEPKQ